jgi:hypothetical protein
MQIYQLEQFRTVAYGILTCKGRRLSKNIAYFKKFAENYLRNNLHMLETGFVKRPDAPSA